MSRIRKAIRPAVIIFAVVLAAFLGLASTAAPLSIPKEPGAAIVPAPVLSPADFLYVALGASYAAGMEDPIASGRYCLKSPDRYPRVVATELGGSFIDKTCSGATTAQVLLGGAKNQKEPQVDSVTPATELVTLTVGSNDVQYMGRLAYLVCLPDGCKPRKKIQAVPDWNKLTESVANVISDIRNRAPNARIVYVGYPKPISSSCLPGTEPSGLTADGFYDEMVAAIKKGAIGAEYVDPTAFVGHDLCSKDPWFLPPRVYGAFHPNSTGREELAKALEAHLREVGEMPEEKHEFNGSSTAAASFQKWFEGGEFVESPIQTRDIRDLTLPNGDIVKPGGYVTRTRNGEFVGSNVP